MKERTIYGNIFTIRKSEDSRHFSRGPPSETVGKVCWMEVAALFVMLDGRTALLGGKRGAV